MQTVSHLVLESTLRCGDSVTIAQRCLCVVNALPVLVPGDSLLFSLVLDVSAQSFTTLSLVRLMSALLNEAAMSKFALSKVFDNNVSHDCNARFWSNAGLQTSRINSLDFNSTGEFFVTSSDDESLHLYQVDSAT